MAIKIEAGSTSATFKVNGKPYQCGAYELIINGNYVGITRQASPGDPVVTPVLFSEYVDSGENPFGSVEALIAEMENIFFLASGGGGGDGPTREEFDALFQQVQNIQETSQIAYETSIINEENLSTLNNTTIPGINDAISGINDSIGENNGICPLGSDGKVPAIHLP